ncbi:CHAP domain-containing protein [Asaia sp. VD9]|uniref:CHAP domain-containing protein n=1 Tax=Asaia sp. VD9 TaxID=3081235 RepID=UPI003018E578
MNVRQKSCLRLLRRPIFSSLTVLSVLVGSAVLPSKAEARQKNSHKPAMHNVHAAHHGASRHGVSIHQTRFTPRRHRSGGHVIQCVAYAKTASDVVLSGNARDWWENSRGVYARGSAPEPGSVLNFRAIRRMPYGHVAVVRAVEDNRTIVIDQSHWAQNGIAKNVRVIDVSPNNDWSAVRVALNSKTETYGSIYPTYGFIYGRPDDGVMMANNTPAPAHRSTRSRSVETASFEALQHPMNSTEVAEAPEDAFGLEGPSRNLR